MGDIWEIPGDQEVAATLLTPEQQAETDAARAEHAAITAAGEDIPELPRKLDW
ncbi:hypothetical protein EV379_1265 [Microterricola gilva]|uniref:Uncharacterized protein n=1 Tax=Microterricola gilva TaxID=393267 RepID=A0A4Q8AKF5_9MICO|nr:hypothetical protein [Microterricola gilva]RZU64954.1 hypothetical protein EV379_1265 [Microterricola gilva]